VIAECPWLGCDQPARLDVLVSVPGEPPGLPLRMGGYCLGHAVIVGIHAQARHGAQLWYAPPTQLLRHPAST